MTRAGPGLVRLVAARDDAGLRLDQFLARRLPGLSRARIQQLIRTGRVAVSRGAAKPARAVEAGLDVQVDIPAPTPSRPQPEALPLVVLHDDDDLAVIDKPAGMVVHPGAGHAAGTLVNVLLHHVRGLSGIGGEERPGIVHRLDRGTSGLMVIAKHDTAHRALARQFQLRTVDKEYMTLVWGAVPAGLTLDTPVGRDPKHRLKMSSRSPRARPAHTTIVEAEPLGGVTLLRVRIATGRTHQIRVHLSEAGHPVVGDALYGGVRRQVPARLAPLSRLGRPFLHAARLAFSHPTTHERLAFESPFPDDLAGLIGDLRATAPPRTPESGS
jgi:23S rRNA pseudouridine1911/1915/1917 synthase